MNNRLKIGYFADGPWSHLAFEKLVQDPSIEIAFIVPRDDTHDQTLKNYARAYQIDYITPIRVNSPEFYDRAARYGCDLFVSMSFNQIFRPRIARLPPMQTINCHAGKLPFYRGRNVLNWVLINDQTEFGITVHYVDEGIDTGDIIVQHTYPITDADTYKTLLDRAVVACADMLYEAIKTLQHGRANPIRQVDIDPHGFYCGIRGPGDEVIDWGQSSRELFNFIRAVCPPGPAARTTLGGSQVRVNAARYVAGLPIYRGTPGQVVGKEEGEKGGGTLLVKTSDTVIYLTDYETDMPVRVGDKFQ